MDLKGIKQSNNIYKWEGTSPALKGFAQSGKTIENFKGLKVGNLAFAKPDTQSLLKAFAVGDTIGPDSKIYLDTTKEDELLAWLQANVGPESKASITLFSNHNENFQLQGMYEKSVDAYFIMVLDLGSSYQVGGYLYTSKAIEGWYENPGFVYGEHALSSDGSYTPLVQYEITEISDVQGWNGILIGKGE